jgi:hypothetical protein
MIAKRNRGKLTLATVIDTASFSGTTGGNSIPLMQEVHERAKGAQSCCPHHNQIRIQFFRQFNNLSFRITSDDLRS